MKKLLLLIMPLLMIFCTGYVLQTSHSDYRLALAVDANSTETQPADMNGWDIDDSNTIDLQVGEGGRTLANNLQLTFSGTGDANDTAQVHVWAYAERGCPAEYVGQLNCNLGTQSVTQDPSGSTSSDVWVDGFTVTDNWIATINTSDEDNNRVSRVWFDACGYRYFQFSVDDVNTISSDGKPDSLNVWWRFF